MKELFLAFVPRFINDQIALTDNGEQYEIACSMVDVNPGVRYDAMSDQKIFTRLGWAIPCGEPTNIRPFESREAV